MGDGNLAHGVRRNVLQGNRHHRQVILHVRALDLGLHRLVVDEHHLKVLGVLHHVVVGDDQKLRVVLPDDDAGASSRGLILLGAEKPVVALEQHLVVDGTTDGMAFSTMSETSSTALTRVLLTVWLPPSEPSAAASVSAGAVVSSVLAGSAAGCSSPPPY